MHAFCSHWYPARSVGAAAYVAGSSFTEVGLVFGCATGVSYVFWMEAAKSETVKPNPVPSDIKKQQSDAGIL